MIHAIHRKNEQNKRNKKNVMSVNIKCLFISIFLFFGFLSSAFASENSVTSLEFQECRNNICTDITNSRFEKSFTVGEKIPMRIIIKNPENAPVFSVQSWVKYNSSILSISELSDDESGFDLAAPGEFKAVNSKGEMRIGRATTGSALTDNEIVVADFVVEIKKNPNLTGLEFLDFKNESIGKTAVITIQGNIPANILEIQPKTLIFKNLKSSAAVNVTQNQQSVSVGIEDTNAININIKQEQEQGQEQTQIQAQIGQNNINIASSVENSESTVTFLPQPTGFRTRTFNDGKIEMIWELNQDSKVKGYYLYYSTTSGIYMHRRDMGKTNMYRFDKNFFKKDRKIFFAVQAYASNGTVSDFSEETFVITGNEGTSSHPFFQQIFPDAKKVGEDIEKNKAYYADISAGENTKKYVQKKTVIKGTQNIQSGINMNLFLIVIGLFFFMGSGIYMIFRKESL